MRAWWVTAAEPSGAPEPDGVTGGPASCASASASAAGSCAEPAASSSSLGGCWRRRVLAREREWARTIDHRKLRTRSWHLVHVCASQREWARPPCICRESQPCEQPCLAPLDQAQTHQAGPLDQLQGGTQRHLRHPAPPRLSRDTRLKQTPLIGSGYGAGCA